LVELAEYSREHRLHEILFVGAAREVGTDYPEHQWRKTLDQGARGALVALAHGRHALLVCPWVLGHRLLPAHTAQLVTPCRAFGYMGSCGGSELPILRVDRGGIPARPASIR
jgi:hypothetical protein